MTRLLFRPIIHCEQICDVFMPNEETTKSTGGPACVTLSNTYHRVLLADYLYGCRFSNNNKYMKAEYMCLSVLFIPHGRRPMIISNVALPCGVGVPALYRGTEPSVDLEYGDYYIKWFVITDIYEHTYRAVYY